MKYCILVSRTAHIFGTPYVPDARIQRKKKLHFYFLSAWSIAETLIIRAVSIVRKLFLN